MAVKYNICDIDENIITENVSIEDINTILEGDEINLFWNDEGLVAQLKEDNEDTDRIQLIVSVETEDEE
jgi:hypothetical protein